MKILFENCVPNPLATQVEKSDIWLTQCELKENHSYQIVAPSGTGKSSLVHILYGMRSDYQGAVYFDMKTSKNVVSTPWSLSEVEMLNDRAAVAERSRSHTPTNANSYKNNDWTTIRRNHISIVFQGLQLFSELTALENIELKNKLTKYKSRSEILELLELFGLGEKRDQAAATLSFGQQQRVAVIRALCQPFEVLLLDEPFSHLDKENTAIAAGRIQHEAQQQGATIVTTLLHANLEIPHDYVFYL
ncbi:MAG: ATP-binding cassette domain-containing protein [Bacteroidetes bacterium]|nr:ATP-binding cassette domain-containing protein [Bacteroidota bacterium]